MNVRLATSKDLPKLKIMFDNIVKELDKNKIDIWDECYPYEEFPKDIANKRLYLGCEEDEIISAFALYDTVAGYEELKWENSQSKAVYLVRFGVSTSHQKQGYGLKTINEAKKIAVNLGAQYLRLQVVDFNLPAIKFYKKAGFKQVGGVFHLIIEETGEEFFEYGFEIKLF